MGNSPQRTLNLNIKVLVTKKTKTKPAIISLEEINIVFFIKSVFLTKMSVTQQVGFSPLISLTGKFQQPEKHSLKIYGRGHEKAIH